MGQKIAEKFNARFVEVVVVVSSRERRSRPCRVRQLLETLAGCFISDHDF